MEIYPLNNIFKMAKSLIKINFGYLKKKRHDDKQIMFMKRQSKQRDMDSDWTSDICHLEQYIPLTFTSL